MKLGFASLVGVEPMPFHELVERAAAIGVDGIEVNCGPTYRGKGDGPDGGHLDLRRIVAEGPDPILDLVRGSGLEITALAPMLNLLTLDLEERRARVAYCRLVIEACAALGVEVAVVYGGSPFGMYLWGLPGQPPDHPSNRVREAVAIFADVVGPLAEHADRNGVRLALETAPRGGGQGNVAHAPELWDRVFEAVASPSLGLSFDPSHLVWLGVPDIPGLIRRYASRIHHFDAKDAEVLPAVLARQGILGSGWWRYRLPGLGAVDWPKVLSTLREVGYTGALGIENEDPVLYGLDGVRWSTAYLRGLGLLEG
ncbi:MAG: sugar phosphate isomerase/epimerase family protein, partial [Candidatus Dormibacteraceae bacterium]